MTALGWSEDGRAGKPGARWSLVRRRHAGRLIRGLVQNFAIAALYQMRRPPASGGVFEEVVFDFPYRPR
jgi:hypothetical protein